jgi:hypothetical protein
LVIGIWDSAEEGFTAFAACVSALALVSAATYASFLVLRVIFDSEHPPVIADVSFAAERDRKRPE